MTVQADHTDALELRLAAGLQRLHREQLGYFASEVQVHLTHDILIIVIEGPELPMLDPAARTDIHDAAGRLVTQITGREIRGVVQDTQPRPDVHVSILQLT